MSIHYDDFKKLDITAVEGEPFLLRVDERDSKLIPPDTKSK